MDITLVYNEIIKELKNSNNQDIVLELERRSDAAATGGEGLSSIGKCLSDLKTNNPSVYTSIRELVESFLKYCKQNGIIIK